MDLNETMDMLPPRSDTILWLDDDPGLIMLVQWALERRGYRVIGYVDVPAALAALTDEPDAYDVVVTDLAMPADGVIDTAKEVMRT